MWRYPNYLGFQFLPRRLLLVLTLPLSETPAYVVLILSWTMRVKGAHKVSLRVT